MEELLSKLNLNTKEIRKQKIVNYAKNTLPKY